MSLAGPVIETERLRLRPPVLDDFDAYAAYVADPAGMAFIGGAQSRPVAWRSFMAYAGAWATSGVSMFWVFERAAGGEGDFVGRIGPWRPEGWPGSEVGWGVAPRFFGRGYAGEAARACMDFAFDRLGWTDVIHSIDPANAPPSGSPSAWAPAAVKTRPCRTRSTRRSGSGARRGRSGAHARRDGRNGLGRHALARCDPGEVPPPARRAFLAARHR